MRLELFVSSLDLFLLNYFNSIKVRLERSGGGHLVASVPFQFHKGAIRTVGRSAARCGDVDFNSIKVRLERSREPTPTMNHPNFNSIKVRLEH